MDIYEEIYHHGILGQKWGVRRYQNKDGTLTNAGKNRYNENYSQKQRLSDAKMYSRGAVKRINRNMNEGIGLKASRSLEANRINDYRKKAKENRRIGKKAGSIVGTILGGAAAGIGVTAARGYMDKYTEFTPIGRAINNVVNDPTIMLATIGVAAGAGGYVGGKIGSSAGNATMRAGGYNPKQLRD